MDFYEAAERRRTTREFLDKKVDFEAIKRILEAGNKAPTWNHNRSWSFIVLRTDEEKEFAFEEAKKTADKFDAEKYLNVPRPYPVTLGQKNVCPRNAEAIYNAERRSLCHNPCI